MDYEKKYKEALETAKAFYRENKDFNAGFLHNIFPELKESEDERIKEQIRELLLDSPSNDLCRIGIDVEKTLAWLEKQGEKKNTHKREIDDAYLQGICDAKHEIEKQGKKLDADKVIEWIVANICDFEYYVKLFKKDFKL